MKKMITALTIVAAPLLSYANTGTFQLDPSIQNLQKKTLTTAPLAQSTKPICICSFDPETGKWTCIPSGCWVDGKPQSFEPSSFDTRQKFPQPTPRPRF